MGIRYYAWPLSSEHVEAARRDPRPFMADDPLADAWFTLNEGNCYLDKAWGGLQLLIADAHPCAVDRPAAWLVAGDVTHVGYGWIEHVGVLDPEELARASADLETICRDLPTPLRPRRPARGAVIERTPLTDLAYIHEYLGVLRKFAAGLAASGKGMIYMIG